jgi:hypothetical protein
MKSNHQVQSTQVYKQFICLKVQQQEDDTVLVGVGLDHMHKILKTLANSQPHNPYL